MEFDDGDGPLGEFLSRRAGIAAEPSLKDGTEVGEWRISGFIGRGGSSEVYCARRRTDGTPAALKILHRSESRHVERFAREARFLETNADGRFPSFFGKGVFDGRPYVAMELLEPLPLPHGDREVARYVCAVAKGVESLHIAGLVHRDIKPGNILWRTAGTGGRPEPVIIDLGLVKGISHGLDAAGDGLSIVDGKEVGVGTPKYAAPEQFSGGDATPATDIHALGRLAYECFGGRPPRVWSRIIRRATSSIPGERYQSARDFVLAVRRRHSMRNIVLSLAASATAVAVAAVAFASYVEAVRRSAIEEGRRLAVEEANRFPLVMDLGGQHRVLSGPVVLEAGKTYCVNGPGTLDADISGFEGSVLKMNGCVILNRTTSLWPENRLKYELENNAYLNFINISSGSQGLDWREFAVIRDKNGRILDGPADNLGETMDDYLDKSIVDDFEGEIRFGGPDSLRNLTGIRWFDHWTARGILKQ